MSILTCTELLRKTARYKEQYAFVSGMYYLRALFKSIFLSSVVFLLESPCMKLHGD